MPDNSGYGLLSILPALLLGAGAGAGAGAGVGERALAGDGAGARRPIRTPFVLVPAVLRRGGEPLVPQTGGKDEIRGRRGYGVRGRDLRHHRHHRHHPLRHHLRAGVRGGEDGGKLT